MITSVGNKLFQSEISILYCPIHAILRRKTAASSNEERGSTSHVCDNTILRDENMLLKKLASGTSPRSRKALGVVAATLLICGTATEASAKSRHYRHYHHSHSVHHTGTGSAERAGGLSRIANAMTAFAHSFTGVASMYGNESGSQTASGQRFNENAMTCAHRSLPFGTKLRVTHGSRSVVVTVNDRGPFIRGRVLDLSTGAARAIGLGGLGQVTAEVVS